MPFAFEMCFDGESDKKIMSIWEALVNNNLPSYMLEKMSKPHITLGIYDRMDIPEAGRLLSDFCGGHKKFSVFLAFIGTFISKENVIFVAPNMTNELGTIHENFHAIFSAHNKSSWFYYLPSVWQPHCSMAIEVPDKDYMRSFEVIRKSFQPMQVTIESIGLVEYFPINVLHEYALQ
jgi:hypothetical protein